MSVLTVILMILKVLGIILLSIIAFILLLLFLVLFVPLRYMVKGSFHDKEIKAVARASWLLHLVSLSYTYGKEDPLAIRILGIRINKKKKTSDLESEASNPTNDVDSKEEIANISEASDTSDSSETSNQSERFDNIKNSTDGEGQIEEVSSENTSEKEKNVHSDKKYVKIKRYLELVKSKRFKKAFELCKDTLVKLLKHILPRKWWVRANLSFDDPETTGKVLGITGALYALFYKHIHVTSDFTGEHIDVDAYFKGHLTTVKILYLAANVYFNKNIKKLIKLFREV